MSPTTSLTCDYCGVSHANYQSHCVGCGGAMPPVDVAHARRRKRRDRIFIAVGATVLLTAALVLSNWLSGPQKVEIVGGTFDPTQPVVLVEKAMPAPGDNRSSMEQRHLTTANLTAAYVAVSSLRLILMEFRDLEGRFPQTFSEIRIDESELADGKYVVGVDLLDGGVLRTRLEPGLFGEDAVLVLSPVDVMAGLETRWDCRTTVRKSARISINAGLECPYDKNAGK